MSLLVTIRCDVKKDKKKEIISPQFHWGGQVPQNRCNFSVFFRQRRQARSEHVVWVTHGRRSKEKKKGKTSCTLYPVHCTHTNCSSYFSPDTGGDCSKHGFMSRQHFLQRNVCFYASETYEKVIYLNVNKSSQLFWCFQMRMRASFVNLVRPLPEAAEAERSKRPLNVWRLKLNDFLTVDD